MLCVCVCFLGKPTRHLVTSKFSSFFLLRNYLQCVLIKSTLTFELDNFFILKSLWVREKHKRGKKIVSKKNSDAIVEVVFERERPEGLFFPSWAERAKIKKNIKKKRKNSSSQQVRVWVCLCVVCPVCYVPAVEGLNTTTKKKSKFILFSRVRRGKSGFRKQKKEPTHSKMQDRWWFFFLLHSILFRLVTKKSRENLFWKSSINKVIATDTGLGR